jgi:hypothetical protein
MARIRLRERFRASRGCLRWLIGKRGRSYSAAARHIIELLASQHLTRELLDHLTAIFPPEAAADLLRAMADGLESHAPRQFCADNWSR